MAEYVKVDAVINESRVECGECGGLLMVRYLGSSHIHNSIEPVLLGEIKCKRHNQGKTCNCINVVQL